MSRDLLKLSRRQFLLLTGAAARLAGGNEDFWDSQPPAEWSVADIFRLLNHSPWAKPVRGFLPPTYGQPALGSRRLSQRLPPPESGPNGVVTWESSLPIRDALKTPLPDVYADCYVIGVDSIPLGAASMDDLKSTAALHSQGKVKWTVRPQVVQELVRASTVYAFGFSRAAAPIGPESKAVVFEARFDRWLIQARFEPRKMLYHGRLAV